jgi:hypothetical protein
MSRYFDKTFFKFLFGFAAIIIVSLIIIFLVKQQESGTEAVPTTNVAQP